MDEKIRAFVQSVRGRNVRESVAAVFVAAYFGFRPFPGTPTDLEVAGSAVVVFACLLVLAVSWGKLHIPSTEPTAYPPAAHPSRWRARMTTQARWLKAAWLWYVFPLLGGVALGIVGRTEDGSTVRVVSLAVVGVLAVGVGLLNYAGGRQTERDRDAWFGPAGG